MKTVTIEQEATPARRRVRQPRVPGGWPRMRFVRDALALLALAGLLAVALIAAAARANDPPRTFMLADPPGTVRVQGFYSVEHAAIGDFRWSSPEATITMPAALPVRYRVTLALQDGAQSPTPRGVAIGINGQPPATFTLTDVLRDYTVVGGWPSGTWRAGADNFLRVRVQTASFSPPGENRTFGVVATRLTLVSEPVTVADLLLPLFGNLLVLAVAYTALRAAGVRALPVLGLMGIVLIGCLGVALVSPDDAVRLFWQVTLRPLWALALLLVLGALPFLARWWQRRAPVARREVVLVVLLLGCYGFFRQIPGWNEASRLALVRALVDDRMTIIDPYVLSTGDLAFYNGHFYSDKAPGSSFLAVPFYLLVRVIVTVAGGVMPPAELLIQGFAFCTSALLTALSALLLLRCLRALVGERWALIVALAFAFGSLAFPFATLYFGHAIAGGLLFAAFYALWRVPDERAPSPWWAVLAGVLAGWAVLVEIPVALGALALASYALVRGWRAALFFLLGGLPQAVLLGYYNLVSFGSPFTLGYGHVTDPDFAAGMSHGLFGVTTPTLDHLLTILIDPRGLLTLAPWLVVAPLGLWMGCWRGPRAEAIAAGSVVGLSLLYNAGFYLPLGGFSPGPRFLVPALPFAALLVGLAPRRLRLLIAPLAALSVGIMALATVTGPEAPDTIDNPVVDFWWPRLLAGQLVQSAAWQHWNWQGWVALLPLALLLLLGVSALLATTRESPTARDIATMGVGGLLVLTLLFAGPVSPALTQDLFSRSVAPDLVDPAR